MVAVTHGAGFRSAAASGAEPGSARPIARQVLHGAQLRQPFVTLGIVAIGIVIQAAMLWIEMKAEPPSDSLAPRPSKISAASKRRQPRTADIVADGRLPPMRAWPPRASVDREVLLLIPADRMRRRFFSAAKFRAMFANRNLSSLRANCIVAPACSCCHCEERSDEAIHRATSKGWILRWRSQ